MTLPLLLLAGATYAWPGDRPRQRLRTNRPKLTRSRPKRMSWFAIPAGAALAWLALGPAGAAAASIIGLTAVHQLRNRRRINTAIARTEGFAEALRSLVAELLSGAHTADAAESAARDAHPEAAETFHAAATAIRLGGDLDTVFAGSGTVRAVGRAWQLALRHGLPLADVLDAVRADLDHQSRFARQVLAKMAGPRASAIALAALPAVGLLLGQAMGAAPLRVLTESPVGQVLLIAGVALVCAGVLWTGKLTGRVINQ